MSQSTTAPSRLSESSGLVRAGFAPQEIAPWLCSVKFWRQLLACRAATLTMWLVGTVYGWTKTSLVHLLNGTAGVPLSLRDVEYAWMIGITVIGSMIGSLLAAQLADRSGRRHCFLVCSTVFTVGWYIIYQATSVNMLYFASLFLGIGVGIARTINPMYVSEVADVNFRGSLSTLIATDVYTGTMLTCALGIWLTYNSLQNALVIISFISFFPIMFFPETPYFLVAKGLKKEACKSISYYKNIINPHEVEIELRALRAQARYELDPQSRCELNQESGNDLPSQSRRNLTPSYSSNLRLPSRSDLPPPYSFNLPSPSSSDLPPPYSSISPPPYRSISPPPYSSISPPPARSDLHPPYRSNLPSQSIRETHPDTTRVVAGTEATSNLDSPSTSDSHASVQSKFKCEINTQPTGEFRVEYSRVSPRLPLQTSRELHSQSTSDLHRPSTSEVHRPSTTEIPPEPTSEIHQPSTSEIHPEPTSEIHPEPTSEIHPEPTSEIHTGPTSEIHTGPTDETHTGTGSVLQSRFRSDLRTEFNMDSQGSTDTDETYMYGTEQTCITKLGVILHRNYRKALYIMLGLIMAQQFSGNFFTMEYLRVLFSKIAHVTDPEEAMILVLFLSHVYGSLNFFIVQFVGRRTLLLLSTGGTCITLIILAIYFLLVGNLLDVSNVSIVPVIDSIIYQVAFEIGLGTLHNVLLCELFPTEQKGFVGAIIVNFDSLIRLMVMILYQVITENVGSYAIYFIFATSCCLAFLMVFRWVPETKGKTYNEIEALLAGENLNSLNEEVRADEMDIRRI